MTERQPLVWRETCFSENRTYGRCHHPHPLPGAPTFLPHPHLPLVIQKRVSFYYTSMCSLNSLRSYVSWHISFANSAHNLIFMEVLQGLATEIIFLNSNRALFLKCGNELSFKSSRKAEHMCLNQTISSSKLDFVASGSHYQSLDCFLKCL